MSQDPGSNHDSSLNDPVSDPGRDPQSERGQSVDKGSAVKDSSDGDQILDDVHDRLCGVPDEEMGGDRITDLLDCEFHGHIVALVLLLGGSLVLDDDTATDLIFNDVRRGHFGDGWGVGGWKVEGGEERSKEEWKEEEKEKGEKEPKDIDKKKAEETGG